MKLKRGLLLISLLCSLASAQGVIGAKAFLGGKAFAGGAGGGGGGGFTAAFLTNGTPCTTGGGSCTNTVSVTAGQLAVGCTGSSSVPVNTLGISDTNSDTFNAMPAGSYLDAGQSISQCWWATMGSTNATEVFTFTCSNIANNCGGGVMMFSGTPSSGWDVAQAGANNAATSSWVSGTSSVTTAANELAVGFFVANSAGVPAWTGTSGWTCFNNAAGAPGIGPCYKILSATGAQTASGTASASFSGGGIVSTIK